VEALSANVITQLLTRSVVAGTTYVGKRIRSYFGRPEWAKKPISNDLPLRTILQRATTTLAASLSADNSDELRLFLISPAVEALVQKLCTYRVFGSEKKLTTDELRIEFCALFAFHRQIPAPSAFPSRPLCIGEQGDQFQLRHWLKHDPTNPPGPSFVLFFNLDASLGDEGGTRRAEWGFPGHHEIRCFVADKTQ
jgi:hypothetical protein